MSHANRPRFWHFFAVPALLLPMSARADDSPEEAIGASKKTVVAQPSLRSESRRLQDRMIWAEKMAEKKYFSVRQFDEARKAFAQAAQREKQGENAVEKARDRVEWADRMHELKYVSDSQLKGALKTLDEAKARLGE